MTERLALPIMNNGMPLDPTKVLVQIAEPLYRNFDRGVREVHGESIGEIAKHDTSFAFQALATGLNEVLLTSRDTHINRTPDGIVRATTDLAVPDGRTFPGPVSRGGMRRAVASLERRFNVIGVDKEIIVVRQPTRLERILGRQVTARSVAVFRASN